uniref:CASP8 and FADD-like apoptosis regulator n=1 Tax=Denticeps clupeoides TaxID=299321 RepID=A0AAY4ARR8_9TELE
MMDDYGLSLTVNRLADCLDKKDVRMMTYLCSGLLTQGCVEDLRGALMSLGQNAGASHGREAPQVLMELVYHLKRFDILKKVLGTSKQEVEQMLRHGCVLSDYRVFIVDLSEDLGKEDLRSLIFLLHDRLPHGKLDEATSFLDLVAELEKLDEVSGENLDLVVQCFRSIQRQDLVKRIQKFQSGGSPGNCPEPHSLRPRTLRPPCTCASRPVACTSQLVPASRELKMAVSETGALHHQASEAYCMETIPCGVCVIIDSVGCDGEMLKQTFEALGFKVILHSWLGQDEICSVLRETARSQELQAISAFSCCILSRGSETHVHGTDSQGPGLQLEFVKQLFACQQLVGKPKLFFTQIYNVRLEDEQYETDGQWQRSRELQEDAVMTIPAAADVLWSVCSMDSRVLERSGHQSVYLRALRSALLKSRPRRIHLLDTLTEKGEE